MRKLNVYLLVPILVACVAGCADTFSVTAIQLGRSLNADSTIGAHTTTFAPTDTIYVSLITSGVGSGEMSVRWKHGAQVVGEPKKRVSSRDGVAFEFHLESAVGFPPGDYTVEAFLDGQPVGTKAFRVQSPQ